VGVFLLYHCTGKDLFVSVFCCGIFGVCHYLWGTLHAVLLALFYHCWAPFIGLFFLFSSAPGVLANVGSACCLCHP
jgi:hypothetical protein